VLESLQVGVLQGEAGTGGLLGFISGSGIDDKSYNIKS
jgi:hypothetical protein